MLLPGPDRTKFALRAAGAAIDEIEDYWAARYLSATEATWRILGFTITKKTPAVTALPVSLQPDVTHRRYRSSTSSGLSKLEHYFARPQGTYTWPDGTMHAFDNLRYLQYYHLFRLAPFNPDCVTRPHYYLETVIDAQVSPMHVIMRTTANAHIARMHAAKPSEGERFYLRALLRHVTGRSLQDCRTIDGVVYETFQQAADALGLFEDDTEAESAIAEGIQALKTPRSLRLLFTHLLVNDCAPNPLHLWELFADPLSRDFRLQNGGEWDTGVSLALQQIGDALEEHGQCLQDYGLPTPVIQSTEIRHELARWGCLTDSLTTRSADAQRLFNVEQRQIFATIMNAIDRNEPMLAFIDGRAGRGKTFLVNALCDHLRSVGRIVLATATAAHAAQLYPGGRTTHATFKVSMLY